MIFGIFLASLVAAFGIDAAAEERKMILTHGQRDALYLIMSVSLLGLVVTLGGMIGG